MEGSVASCIARPAVSPLFWGEGSHGSQQLLCEEGRVCCGCPKDSTRIAVTAKAVARDEGDYTDGETTKDGRMEEGRGRGMEGKNEAEKEMLFSYSATTTTTYCRYRPAVLLLRVRGRQPCKAVSSLFFSTTSHTRFLSLSVFCFYVYEDAACLFFFFLPLLCCAFLGI